MRYIYNLKIRVDLIDNLEVIILKNLRLKKNDLLNFEIVKKSIDARKKNNILYVLQIKLESKKEIKHKDIILYKEPFLKEFKEWDYQDRPIIIGFGPAGMFAGLVLARAKAKPIIIERGKKVDKRKEDILNFWHNKIFNTESNVCFGEGGAGTFSDGKLQSNIKNEYNYFVLNEFYKHGANKDILVNALPHIGTDILETVVKNIREEIMTLGGEFFFETCFLDYEENDNGLKIKCSHNLEFTTKHLILALGHSAKDTFEMLYKHNIKLEPKPFSMGVRIEHLQNDINQIQYGEFAKYLEAAPYKLVCHLKDRSVYSFCMCPGGYVVPSQSDDKTILTNGMSYSKRDAINANSALLVEIKVEDFYKNSPLDGFKLQEKYEKEAFLLTKDFQAPGNLVKEFLNDEIAHNFRKVKTTYLHGIKFSKLPLPNFVIESLKEALPVFDRIMPGFSDDDAIIVAPETRSSSPVRIVRENYKSSNKYIYPIGEGSGYAGGIMTSAIDGLKLCNHLLNKEK